MEEFVTFVMPEQDQVFDSYLSLPQSKAFASVETLHLWSLNINLCHQYQKWRNDSTNLVAFCSQYDKVFSYKENMNKTTYCIVSGSRESIELQIQAHLDRGWALVGGLAIASSDRYPPVFYQAVIKISEVVPEEK